MKKHWTAQDFIITHQANYKYGEGITPRKAPDNYGYCAKCGCDMQQFNGGVINHYKSHHNRNRPAIIIDNVPPTLKAIARADNRIMLCTIKP
jgi:hypothetical protein